MKCPFCAEEIQDEAIICRFCSARKVPDGGADRWISPAMTTDRTDSALGGFAKLTIVGSGVLLIFGGATELIAISDPVPLFGALRGGAVASVYHLTFSLLFLVTGAGLVKREFWSERIFIATTLIYSVDRLLFLADSGAQAAYVKQQIQSSQLQQFLDASTITSGIDLLTGVTVLSWWIFAAYVLVKFRPRSAGSPMPSK